MDFFLSYFGFGPTIAILRDITEGGIDIPLACMPIRIFGSDFLESCLKIPLVQIGSIPESARSVQVQEKVAHIVPILLEIILVYNIFL